MSRRPLGTNWPRNFDALAHRYHIAVSPRSAAPRHRMSATRPGARHQWRGYRSHDAGNSATPAPGTIQQISLARHPRIDPTMTIVPPNGPEILRLSADSRDYDLSTPCTMAPATAPGAAATPRCFAGSPAGLRPETHPQALAQNGPCSIGSLRPGAVPMPRPYFNGPPIFRAICPGDGPPRVPPGVVVQMAAERRRTPRRKPPSRAGRRVRPLFNKILVICGPLTRWLWARASVGFQDTRLRAMADAPGVTRIVDCKSASYRG